MTTSTFRITVLRPPFFSPTEYHIYTTSATLPEIADPLFPGLDFIHTTEREVLEILSSLDTSKASGPDGISPKLLISAAPAISCSLTKLFNLSLEKQKFT